MIAEDVTLTLSLMEGDIRLEGGPSYCSGIASVHVCNVEGHSRMYSTNSWIHDIGGIGQRIPGSSGIRGERE